MVLVLGHRRGITHALEKFNIPYIIWSTTSLKSKPKAERTIVAPFPKDQEALNLQNLPVIDHVIAGTEKAVFPATKIRLWLKARRNPISVILRCTDKLKMKEFLHQKDIPMTDFMGSQEVHSPDELFDRLGNPVVAKPRNSSGGRGIELLDKNTSAFEPDKSHNKIFERKIEGTEGSVESFIVDSKIVFTNITQYFYPKICNLVPAHYQQNLIDEILDLNKKVIASLNIQWGMTHLEFYCTAKGILFGEVALRPPGGYIMESLNLAYGGDFWEIFVLIEIDSADVRIPKIKKNFSASYIIYPGAGEVIAVPSKNEFSDTSSLVKLKIKMKAGDIIKPRDGVGVDYGYALFKNTDKHALEQDLQNFQKLLFEGTILKK